MALAADHEGQQLVFPNTSAGLRIGLKRLGDWLRRTDVGQVTGDNASLVFEEIVTNIIRYGFDDEGEHRIRVGLRRDADALTLVFEDEGRPFDPRLVPKPAWPKSIEDAPIGGRGLLLVNAAASGLDYERTADGQNRLTVTVPLSEHRQWPGA